MALSENDARRCSQRLLLSRMRILCNNGFYGLLLMHMKYRLEEDCPTACTDGKNICFGPRFMDELSDSELDFVMMHEIMHVVLRHCARQGDRDSEAFNVACDIVVNSNILRSCDMDKKSITLSKYGVSMHYAPNGREGYDYTAEQVYEMLPRSAGKKNGGKSGKKSGGSPGAAQRGGNSGGSGPSSPDKKGVGPGRQNSGSRSGGSWDDHSRWGSLSEEEEKELDEEWAKRFKDACEAISIRDPSNTRGLLPMFAQRILGELKKPQLDWRTILNEFVQEEITDYSFAPPDRRYPDSPFFLPDFNDTEYTVRNILFMIDTSGSISDDMITAAYSEIKGAIDQFGGKLEGLLGFFDAAVSEPKPFSDSVELKKIRPMGGGGTDFHAIFKYIARHMSDEPPASVIILTDGFAPYPPEAMANGIPVLWLLNNEYEYNEPPWGKAARISV